MPYRIVLLIGLATGLMWQAVAAQDLRSPYTGIAGREIKALSEDEVRQLEAGDGMELALAAELNGYPGPKHLLELADTLGLSAAQRRGVEEIRRAMLAEAQNLGTEIVARERELDRGFASHAIDVEGLDALTTELGRLRGALRFAHLRAHLATLPLLSDAQVAAYARLRGYAHAADGHGHH